MVDCAEFSLLTWVTFPCDRFAAREQVNSYDLPWLRCRKCRWSQSGPDLHPSNRGGIARGAGPDDPDPFHPDRTIRLTIGHIVDFSKGGKSVLGNLRAECTNCNEGLQNTSLPKPSRIELLKQIRRATLDDQRAVLEWLDRKFRSRDEAGDESGD